MHFNRRSTTNRMVPLSSPDDDDNPPKLGVKGAIFGKFALLEANNSKTVNV